MEEWACSISSASAGLRREEMWPSNRGRETEIWTIKCDHKKTPGAGEERQQGRIRALLCVWSLRPPSLLLGESVSESFLGPGRGGIKYGERREVCTIKGMFAFACAGRRATEALFYVEHKQANTGMFGPLWGDYRVICKYIEQPTQHCAAFQSNTQLFPVWEDSLKLLRVGFSVWHNIVMHDNINK